MPAVDAAECEQMVQQSVLVFESLCCADHALATQLVMGRMHVAVSDAGSLCMFHVAGPAAAAASHGTKPIEWAGDHRLASDAAHLGGRWVASYRCRLILLLDLHLPHSGHTCQHISAAAPLDGTHACMCASDHPSS